MNNQKKELESGKGDARPMGNYQALAAIYDRVMRHVPYRKWAKYVIKILQMENAGGVRILDVGCGTGKFLLEMNKLGYAVDGCDPVEEMLLVARSRNPDAKLWQDKFPELSHVPGDYYQVFTCLYDAINYIPTLEAFRQALHRVNELLPPGGFFIFDAVSQYYCKNYLNHWREEETLDKKYAYRRYSRFDEMTGRQLTDFTINTPEGIREEHHIQTIFRFRDLKQTIHEIGAFELLGFYDDFTFLDAYEKSDRAHFVLRKKSQHD